MCLTKNLKMRNEQKQKKKRSCMKEFIKTKHTRMSEIASVNLINWAYNCIRLFDDCFGFAYVKMQFDRWLFSIASSLSNTRHPFRIYLKKIMPTVIQIKTRFLYVQIVIMWFCETIDREKRLGMNGGREKLRNEDDAFILLANNHQAIGTAMC